MCLFRHCLFMCIKDKNLVWFLFACFGGFVVEISLCVWFVWGFFLWFLVGLFGFFWLVFLDYLGGVVLCLFVLWNDCISLSMMLNDNLLLAVGTIFLQWGKQP